jgi:hypothetical protein
MKSLSIIGKEPEVMKCFYTDASERSEWNKKFGIDANLLTTRNSTFHADAHLLSSSASACSIRGISQHNSSVFFFLPMSKGPK